MNTERKTIGQRIWSVLIYRGLADQVCMRDVVHYWNSRYELIEDEL